jgi:hypothetical protein
MLLPRPRWRARIDPCRLRRMAQQQQADGHLHEIHQPHQHEHPRRTEVVQHAAAQRRAGDCAQVHHHRKQADGAYLLVGAYQAHDVGIHQQIAGLEGDHRQRHRPEQPLPVDGRAGQRQHAGYQLTEDQQPQRVSMACKAHPHGQCEHRHQAHRGQVQPDLLAAQLAEAFREVLRVERHQQAVAEHCQQRHADQRASQRHRAATAPCGASDCGRLNCWKAIFVSTA